MTQLQADAFQPLLFYHPKNIPPQDVFFFVSRWRSRLYCAIIRQVKINLVFFFRRKMALKLNDFSLVVQRDIILGTSLSNARVFCVIP